MSKEYTEFVPTEKESTKSDAPMQMDIMEAWRLYQSLKSTFSVANKKTIVEYFFGEFSMTKIELEIETEKMILIVDTSLYNEIPDSNTKIEALKEAGVIMTADEWYFKPLEDGLMPFLFDILSALNTKRSKTK